MLQRLVLSLILCASTPLAFSASPYKDYVNERYGYRISYPADFIPQGVSGSGDGQTFIAPGKDARLLVFASACMEDSESNAPGFISTYEQEQKAGDLTVSYKRAFQNAAVVSGLKSGRIFYHKILFDKGWCTQFKFEYDESARNKYDDAVKRIAASFRQ